MQTSAIYIRTEPRVKEKAKKVARELGFSLSSLMNAWLKQLIRTKAVNFSLTDEEPSEYLLRVMKKAEDNKKAGKASPVFENSEDAISWLEQHGV